MNLIGALLLSLSVIFCGMWLGAQDSPQPFSLPDAREGEAYRVNIEAVLRDKYRLKLDSDSRSRVYRWTLKDGELPEGLALHPDGNLLGTPKIARTQPYNFQVQVTNDEKSNDEPLIIGFSLIVR